MLKNIFNKFSSNVCNFCFSVVTCTKEIKNLTSCLKRYTRTTQWVKSLMIDLRNFP